MHLDSEMDLLDNKTLLVTVINNLLTAILDETRQFPRGNSKFHCKDIPIVSVRDYLIRIAKYAHCSNSVYVVALIYIDRLQQRTQNFIINKFCIHRLLISSVMLAAKFFDDFYYKNQYYAKIGGINKSEINLLELQLLKKFDYNLNITDHEFKIYLQKLQGYSDMSN